MGSRFEHLEFDDHAPRRRQRELQQEPPQAPPPEQPGLLASEPMDPHDYHRRAVEAFHRGDFDPALQFFTRVLELDAGFVPAWVGQVQMLVELGELREAVLWADKALEMFRDQGDLMSGKAVAKARQGDRRTAMACSDAAVAVRNTSAYRWLARGEVLLATNQGQPGACFDRAVLQPDADWFTRVWIARIHYRYRKYTPAFQFVRVATEQAPDKPFAWYVRGECERELAIGTYRKCFQRALELDPRFALARSALQESSEASWLRRLFRRFSGR